jgi:uncharacterized membrane protein
MGTNRLEGFSDGVIAVAITLLVLGITVPEPGGSHSLGYKLAHQWPEYAAYVISFATIGIIWINHHVMIGRLRKADHSIMILNLLLLMSIGALPFATALMATYLRHAEGENLAAAVYGGAFLVMGLLFSALVHHILIVKAHMLSNQLPLERRRQILMRFASGAIPYAIATALAAVSAYATLAICGGLALFYALPIASGGAADDDDDAA